MRVIARKCAVALASTATVVAISNPQLSFAEEVAPTENYGPDSTSIPPDDSTDAPDAVSTGEQPVVVYRPVCTSHYEFDITDKGRSFLEMDRFQHENRTTQTIKFRYSAGASKSNSVTTSGSVSAELGIEMFGTLKAEVSHAVQKTMSYEASFGGSMEIPPKRMGIARLGFARAWATGKTYFYKGDGSDQCVKQDGKFATIKAPRGKTWIASIRNLP